MRYNKGFTLLELLIALAVSSLVILGVSAMFSSIANIRDKSVNESQNIIVEETLTRLLNKDARMIIDSTISIDEQAEGYRFKFSTQNTLRFNKAVPVEISYYIDEENWLIRRETNTDMLYDMEMRVIPDVKDLKVYFYDGSEYKDTVKNNAKMMIFDITINGIKKSIPIARTMDNVQ